MVKSAGKQVASQAMVKSAGKHVTSQPVKRCEVRENALCKWS